MLSFEDFMNSFSASQSAGDTRWSEPVPRAELGYVLSASTFLWPPSVSFSFPLDVPGDANRANTESRLFALFLFFWEYDLLEPSKSLAPLLVIPLCKGCVHS